MKDYLIEMAIYFSESAIYYKNMKQTMLFYLKKI